MKRLFYSALTAFLFSIVLLAGNLFAADSEEKDKRIYGSEFYDDYRKITYWGSVYLSIRDYHYNSGDAEYLELIVKDKTKKVETYNPRDDIKQHFMGEFKRLFVEKFNLPFHDTEKGRDERFEKFFRENPRDDVSSLHEKWMASEVARRRSLYGGHPGSILCNIKAERRKFPVLYEISCSVSAKEDLSYDRWFESENIGFSSQEHINGELKTAITEILKEKSLEFSKIKKYGR